MKLETLSTILQNRFGISEEMMATAEALAIKDGAPLKEVLVRKKIIPEKLILKALEFQYDIPFQAKLNLNNKSVDFIEKIPIHFLKKYHILPLLPAHPIKKTDIKEPGTPDTGISEGKAESSTMVINDPASIQAVDDLASLLEISAYELVFSTKGEILSGINTFYDKKSDRAQQIVQDMEDNVNIISEFEKTSDLLDDNSDTPIIKLVNHMISQSVKASASDIHIEPRQDSLKIRYRIDGILYDLLEPAKWIQSSLITRIKVMANMDIAEKRLPQDSRIEVRIGNKDIDIRISTIPTTLGERVVMRLLDKSSSLLSLSQFGIPPQRLQMIRDLSRLPNGIILMTGPTGSGKTTTLYAMLSEINKSDVNIITVEDPVEYKLEGISQIQVNSKIGLTFAKSLRSIVRQDPDVILIGEIRDQETASIAVQAALTGHLVLSTLHTNDSASAITRLVDIGIEPFLITSAVRAVMAQRLIRVLCDECKETYMPDEEMLKNLGLTKEDCQSKQMYKATGCKNCFHTGYKGRTPIFEILPFDEKIKNTILKTSDASKIREVAVAQNMSTLLQNGIEKFFKGITTIEEVLRVTQL
jgi:general secretion pathway protein E